uniref:Uncharacterized protein n=1 Tax=Callorhinchus milii TaxID=7868 RepID=A0A4W3H404_CALMI
MPEEVNIDDLLELETDQERTNQLQVKVFSQVIAFRWWWGVTIPLTKSQTNNNSVAPTHGRSRGRTSPGAIGRRVSPPKRAVAATRRRTSRREGLF